MTEIKELYYSCFDDMGRIKKSLTDSGCQDCIHGVVFNAQQYCKHPQRAEPVFVLENGISRIDYIARHKWYDGSSLRPESHCSFIEVRT